MAMVDADGSILFRPTQSKFIGLFSGLAATSALRLHTLNERMNLVNSRNGLPWWQHHKHYRYNYYI